MLGRGEERALHTLGFRLLVHTRCFMVRRQAGHKGKIQFCISAMHSQITEIDTRNLCSRTGGKKGDILTTVFQPPS